jgi:hypothetical protein
MTALFGTPDLSAVLAARRKAANAQLDRLSDEQLWDLMVMAPHVDLRLLQVPTAADRVCWTCGAYTAREPHLEWCRAEGAK